MLADISVLPAERFHAVQGSSHGTRDEVKTAVFAPWMSKITSLYRQNTHVSQSNLNHGLTRLRHLIGLH